MTGRFMIVATTLFVATGATAQVATQKQLQAIMSLAMLSFAEDNCLGRPDQSVINLAIRQPTLSLAQGEREILFVEALRVVEDAAKKSSISGFCIKVNESFGSQGKIVLGAWRVP